MSEMVERVARAIYEKIHSGPVSVPWETVQQFGSEAVWADLARAAIEAMRVPTEGMIGAAMIQPHPTVAEAGGLIEQGQQAIKLDWQAMIDEALR